MNTPSMAVFWSNTSAVKRRIPRFMRGRGQMLQQDRPEPATLLRILDQEGNLRFGVTDRVAVVGPGPDDVAAQFGDQPDPGVVVDVGEDRDVLVGDRIN